MKNSQAAHGAVLIAVDLISKSMQHADEHTCDASWHRLSATFRYTDGNLDEGLVDLVRKLCVGVIEANGERTLSQLVDFCRSRPGLESKMTGDHVKQILQTLIYDGMVRFACLDLICLYLLGSDKQSLWHVLDCDLPADR